MFYSNKGFLGIFSFFFSEPLLVKAFSNMMYILTTTISINF